jgi:N-acetylmuramoyl-L-alanine amidase
MFAGLMFVLAGCANAPIYKAERKPLPPDWDSELGSTHELENLMAEPAPPAVGAAPTNLPPVRPKPAGPDVAAPETGMIALSLWAKQHGVGPVRYLQLTPPAYTVKTPHGNFTVRHGSQIAYWDRMEVRLGFAAKLIGDQIYLHALDVKKILTPLAYGTAVATPAERLVVIDPGHGGANSGTRNIVTGRHEKDYTLDWARRLKPLLEQSGWRVVLTRTNDVEMKLPERVAFTEAQGAHLFISLHFNSAGENGGPAGLETYCLTPVGMPSSLTRGYDDDERQVFPNNAFDVENLRYAVRLHRALLQVNGNLDRGVRHARFLGVLQGHRCPAVLIEAGYFSNPTEARRVADVEYRQKLAEAVAKALE